MRTGVYALVLIVVLAATTYLAVAAIASRSPALSLDAMVALVALAFLLHARPRPAEREKGQCPICESRLRRTRDADGSRFWTCSACGFERARKRSRAPKATAH